MLSHSYSRLGVCECLLLMLSTVAIGCAKTNEYQPPPPVEVNVATPLIRDVTIYMEETGTTEAVERVEIRARVEGFIEEIKFEPNEIVEANQVLFVLERRRYQAARDMASAELDAQKVSLEKAKIEYARQKELFDKKATPETNLVAARAEMDGAEAAVLSAEAHLDEAQLNLDYTEVRTPIKGQVGKALVKKGNLVTGSPSTHLATVISYDNIYANFSITERDYLEFLDTKESMGADTASDMPLYLARATDDDFPFQGRFNFADLAVDESTGTFAVRAIFPNPNQKIVPGLFVRIRAPIEVKKDALLIPERATGFDQTGMYVLIVNAENEVERRNIEVGNKFGEMVVALTGLEPTDRVIIDGIQQSRPGAVVDPKETTLTMDESLLNPPGPKPKSTDSQPDADVPSRPMNDQPPRTEGEPESSQS
ncbi:efflux RND transporter periplasmic adaptor subunit [Bremerella sp. JC817]|uniref:efflux RND transporter periplasmic adaptor subunit n=1 Tax=Bremerella sp. JC817 TaxID=3231756 RepID=UPI00345B17CB